MFLANYLSLKANLKIRLIITLLIIILAFSMVLAGNFSAQAFDARVREAVQDSRTNTLDHFMDSATHLGDGIITGSVALSISESELQKHAVRTQLVAAVSTAILKFLIGRRRPSGEEPDPFDFKPFELDSSYHSMPSGHTSSAFALAASLAENTDDYKLLTYSLAALVGFTRIYRDNHWVSDVIAGAGIGYLSARFVSYKW